jgi:hypothetical protein
MINTQIVYLVCEPFMVYGDRGERLEPGEQVLFASLSEEKAILKLKELNLPVEEEEGDLPYFIIELPLD